MEINMNYGSFQNCKLKATHLLSSVSRIFNKLATFARTCADATTFDGKLSCANPTFSNISLIRAAIRDFNFRKNKMKLFEFENFNSI